MKSFTKLTKRFHARTAVTLLLAMFAFATAFAQALTISSDADWVTFANNVNNGMSYSGQTVKLAADINVTTVVGTDSTKFKGTFDGAGHKINVNLTASEDRCAPFRYVDGATISLLTVTGTVSTGTNKYGAGLIAESTGSVTVKNCRSSVTISGDRSSLSDKDATHGGFVSLEESGSLTFINCLFDGLSCLGYCLFHGCLYLLAVRKAPHVIIISSFYRSLCPNRHLQSQPPLSS